MMAALHFGFRVELLIQSEATNISDVFRHHAVDHKSWGKSIYVKS